MNRFDLIEGIIGELELLDFKLFEIGSTLYYVSLKVDYSGMDISPQTMKVLIHNIIGGRKGDWSLDSTNKYFTILIDLRD